MIKGLYDLRVEAPGGKSPSCRALLEQTLIKEKRNIYLVVEEQDSTSLLTSVITIFSKVHGI